LKRIRPHLTYANTVATLALFIALGGSSYAAVKITGKNVRNGSLTGKDIKRKSIGSRPIKQSSLKAVANAKRVGGKSARGLILRCPKNTVAAAGACVERAARPALPWASAAGACRNVERPGTAGRRLPTIEELGAAVSYNGVPLTAGGELTANLATPSGPRINAQVLTDQVGSVRVVPNTFEGRAAYRCAVTPLNG